MKVLAVFLASFMIKNSSCSRWDPGEGLQFAVLAYLASGLRTKVMLEC